MSESVSRLARLRFLERVQLRDLERTRRWILEEERRLEEQRRGEAARPPAPDWVLETGIGDRGRPVYVHVGGCHMIGKHARGARREEALRAMTDGGVDACPHCRPDTALGVLE